MADSNAALAAIAAAAKKYNLDPKAMAAVAKVESGLRPGAIGDGGHAFGLFQFNNAGGVITGEKNPKKFLDPNFNAMEAARHIASIPGAQGAKGKAAIDIIVNKFERPANAPAEVSKAYANYGGISDQAISRASQYAKIVGIDSKAPVTAPNGSLASGNGNGSTSSFDPSQALLGYLLQQSNPAHGSSDPTAELMATVVNPMAEAATAVQTAGAAKAPTAPVTTTTTPGKPADIKVTGPTPVVGVKGAKLIGTPYQGTHKLYNNWESDNAIDIAVPAKTPVYATEDGVIGDRIGHINTKDAHMVGQRVNLAGSDNSFYYQHLETITVKAGQKVKKGDLIGYSGATNHIHFGVEKGDPRQYYK